MSTKLNHNSKESKLLECSNQLFIEHGYIATTMRQIAGATETSLGLATYYFKSKRNIAVCIITGYLRYLKKMLSEQYPSQECPLARSAAMVRLCIEFFLSHPCRQFYLECMNLEIYMQSIQSLGNDGLSSIAQAYKVDASPDMLLLFDNYIPPSVERILLIEKEKGNFPNISWDAIPDIVFSISVERYLEKKEIRDASLKGREIARKTLRQIPQDITQLLFKADVPRPDVSNVVVR